MQMRIVLLVLALFIILSSTAMACPLDFSRGHFVRLQIFTPGDSCKMPTSETTVFELPELEACAEPLAFTNVTISEVELEDGHFFGLLGIPEYTYSAPVIYRTSEEGVIELTMSPIILYQILVENQTGGINLFPHGDNYEIWIKER
jgi:hypothetical protein